MKMEKIEFSETLAHKIQRPGNYPEENTQHFTKKNQLMHLFQHFHIHIKTPEDC
jgi:hypothetical protein